MLKPVDSSNAAFKGGPFYINALTYMSRQDAMGPILALEGTVDVGRATNAYKRGGKNEMRERIIEDLTGAAVWLFGVKVLNGIGDKILKAKYGANFDVGSDVLRTPFENFVRNNKTKPFAGNTKAIALLKFAKVITSVLIADAFIGLVVPKMNQKITRVMIAKDKEKENKAKQNAVEQNINNKSEVNEQKTEQSNKIAFKGGRIAALNVFTNAIENTNVGKLLSTDAGLVSGRMYSARNDNERREIAIRDIGSMYFFYWAIGHVGKLLNLAESGKATRLNPDSAGILNDQLINFLKENGNEMDVNKFQELVLGKNSAEIKLPEGIKFEVGEVSKWAKFFNKKKQPLEVAKVSDLEGLFSPEIMERIKGMSKLQPLRQGEAVVTKQQIIDAVNKAEINNPELLDKVFNQFTKGAHKNEYKYVSNDTLYELKADMETYVKNLCKKAKDGKITKEVLEKAKTKNIIFSGLNFIAGFAFAALFLSTLIPKFQYWVTRKRTGVDAFPGTYEYDNKQAEKVEK